MPDLLQDTTVKKETGEANPDHNLSFENITAQVIAILTEVAQGHNTGTDGATTGVAHDDHAPPIEDTAINLTMIHHTDLITDHPQIEVLQLINPEIAVGHTHDHQYQSLRKDYHISSSHSSKS